jgi:cytochrome c-type biogenesis protein CcmH/NrfG
MKALALQPLHCEAASYVGELYLQIERFEQAAAAYSRLQALSSRCTYSFTYSFMTPDRAL